MHGFELHVCFVTLYEIWNSFALKYNFIFVISCLKAIKFCHIRLHLLINRRHILIGDDVSLIGIEKYLSKPRPENPALKLPKLIWSWASNVFGAGHVWVHDFKEPVTFLKFHLIFNF